MAAAPPPKQSLRKRLTLTLRDVIHYIGEAQLPLVASSQAYITILAVIPMVALSFSIFQAFGGVEKLYGFIEPFIIQNLTEGASAEAVRAFRAFISNIHAGTLGAGGLIGLIFTSMSLLLSAENAINRVWRARQTRPLFHRVAVYWLFVTLGPLAVAVLLGVATTGRGGAILAHLPGGTAIFLIVTLVFFAVYKLVPNRAVHWQPAIISAVLTSIVWNLAKEGYALYTQKVLTYNKIYGSLAAVPIFLLWIYIVWLIVLSGAAVTAALQKRFDFHEHPDPAPDTPRAPDRPALPG